MLNMMLNMMGQQSDNTAYGIMLKKLGERKVVEMMQEIGMNNTSLATNDTTPRDIGVFFVKLWKGEILKDESREELLVNLTDTNFEDRIPKGVPEGVRVAHKIGNEAGGVYNDAGIVMGENPFVLVILTRGAEVAEVPGSLQAITRLVWEEEK